METIRFYYQNRSNKCKRAWAVKVIITEEEKKDLEEGASLLGDEYISSVIGRIDVFVPCDDKNEPSGSEHKLYWFWIYENEMSDVAFSIFFCLSALAKKSTPHDVKIDYLSKVED